MLFFAVVCTKLIFISVHVTCTSFLYLFYPVSTLLLTGVPQTIIRTETPFLVKFSTLCTSLLTHLLLFITRQITSPASFIRPIPINIFKTFRITTRTLDFSFNTFDRKLLTGLHRINPVRIKLLLINVAVLAVSFFGF